MLTVVSSYTYKISEKASMYLLKQSDYLYIAAV